MYAKRKTRFALNMKTSNNVFKDDGLGSWKGSGVGRQPGAVHLLEVRLYVLQQAGIDPLLHTGEGSKLFLLPELEGLFVAFVLEFDADFFAHFEHSYFQRWMFDMTNDAHGRNF